MRSNHPSALVLSILLAVLPAGVAHAQWLATSTTLGRAPVTEREIERIVAAARLDEASAEAVRTLAESFRLEHAQAWEAFAEEAAATRERMKEAQDAMPYAEWSRYRLGFQQDRTERRARFFDELELLLTEDQRAALEPLRFRLRRAESVGMRGVLARQDVDLVGLVEGLGLTEAGAAAAAPVLDRHARELDRLLQRRDALMAELMVEQVDLQIEGRGDPMPLVEDFQRLVERARPIEQSIRNKADEDAARLSAALEGADRERFEAAFASARFPNVHAPSPFDAAMERVMGLPSIGDDQAARLGELRGRYESSAAAIEARWERALLEHDGDVGVREIWLQLPPSEDVRDAVRDRRELDEASMGSLRELLTPQQREAVPDLEAGSWRGRSFGDG